MSRTKKSFLASGIGILFAGTVMMTGVYFGAFGDSTNRLDLDLVDAYQADKYATVNENTYKLDAMVQTTVVGSATNPTDADALFGTIDDGSMFLVIATAESTWLGKEDQLAYYLNSTWTYFTPGEGWKTYDANLDVHYIYTDAVGSDQWVPFLNTKGNGLGQNMYDVIHIVDGLNITYDSQLSLIGNSDGGSVQMWDTNQLTHSLISARNSDAESYIGKPLIVNTSAAIDGSAALQVVSTDKGMMPPVMTSVQRGAISTPATGLMVYDTDLGTLTIYTGAAWEQVDLSAIP